MKKPRSYLANVRSVALSNHLAGTEGPVAEHVNMTLDLADPTVKHGHRGAHLALTPEQARTLAKMLERCAIHVEQRSGPMMSAFDSGAAKRYGVS